MEVLVRGWGGAILSPRIALLRLKEREIEVQRKKPLFL